MIQEYLKLLTRRRINFLYLGILLVVQGLQLVGGIHEDNAIYEFMALKGLNVFALFFTPIFCFWNASAYQLSSETKLVVRMGSPFSAMAFYIKLALISGFLYVVFSNCITVVGAIIATETVGKWGILFILLFFQLVFYINCALLYFITMALLQNKSYFAFLIVVFYGLWDYIGSLLMDEPWLNISTSYVVCSVKDISSIPLLLRNFSILMGVCLALLVIGLYVTDKRDYLDWGKAHD